MRTNSTFQKAYRPTNLANNQRNNNTQNILCTDCTNLRVLQLPAHEDDALAVLLDVRNRYRRLYVCNVCECLQCK